MDKVIAARFIQALGLELFDILALGREQVVRSHAPVIGAGLPRPAFKALLEALDRLLQVAATVAALSPYVQCAERVHRRRPQRHVRALRYGFGDLSQITNRFLDQTCATAAS